MGHAEAQAVSSDIFRADVGKRVTRAVANLFKGAREWVLSAPHTQFLYFSVGVMCPGSRALQSDATYLGTYFFDTSTHRVVQKYPRIYVGKFFVETECSSSERSEC